MRRGPRCAARRRERGLTLVELLVVVVILTTLVAAALPLMAPSGETRRLREAARTLNTAITTAQTKATERGRPFGIWLEKATAPRLDALKGLPPQQVAAEIQQPTFQQDRGAVLTVYFCEEPQPYTGRLDSAAVMLTTTSGTSASPPTIARFGHFLDGQFIDQPLPPGIIRPGDRLVVAGSTFRFVEPANSTDGFYGLKKTPVYQVQIALDSAAESQRVAQQRWNYAYVPEKIDESWTFPAKYVIRRQPQKVDDPLQLPAGIAIDLEASGERLKFYHDPNREPPFGLPMSNDTPVAILFSPGGAVHSIIRNDGGDGVTGGLPPPNIQSHQPDGAIFLMVGRRERVGESQRDPSKTTWLDPESLWVSIGPQTGRVVTEQNSVSSTVTMTADYDVLVQQRLTSRAFAQQGQGMGGR